MKVLLVITLLFFCAAFLEAEDEHIFVDAKINGQPVRFAFDTGTSVPYLLFSKTARKLNLTVTQPPADTQIPAGQIRVGWTDPENLDFGFTNMETTFAVEEVPTYLKTEMDGFMGWPALTNNVFLLDCLNHEIHFLTNAPSNMDGWIKCHIETNYSDLTLELPGKNNLYKIICLDSGSDYGVELNPQKWQEWKANHTNQPITLEAYFTPNPGLVVTEEAWADKISLGILKLTGLPVMQADSGEIALHVSPKTQFEATLGLAAMKRLDMIIDGKNGVAYLRPKSTAPLPYDHNRLGAVFVPLSAESDDLIGHVENGSPAFKAGIRDGDILLKIGNLDCTKWRSDPNVLPLSRFWNNPSGTKLEFTLKRGDKILKTPVTLQNILPPDPMN